MNRLLEYFLVALLCLVYASPVSGQGWQTPPNLYLPSFTRFEDVYFTDTLTGYAVAISDFWNVDTSYKPIYKTINGGYYWFRSGDIMYGSSALRSIEFLSDNATGVIGSLNGSVYRTTNAGSTWANISAGVSDTAVDSSPGRRNICGWAHYDNNFYGVGWWGAKTARFYKSTNKGITWSTSYLDTNLATGLVNAVFVSANTGFVSGCRNIDGGMYTSNSGESVILKTTDGGITWTKVFSDTVLGGRVWKIQAIDRMNLVGSIEPYYYPDTVCIVKSTDGGNTWSIITVGSVPGLTTYAVTQGVGFATKDIGWAGGYYPGIFQTLDGGATWDTLNFGLNFNRIFIVDSNHAFAGGATVYKWSRIPPAPDTTADTASHTAVHDPGRPPHILYKISPNPATGHQVRIEFDLLRETNVVLQVVNTDLRRHMDIARERMKPGHYTYYWNSGDLPAGNYLVWLGTDEVPLTQKFTLVR